MFNPYNNIDDETFLKVWDENNQINIRELKEWEKKNDWTKEKMKEFVLKIKEKTNKAEIEISVDDGSDLQ